MQKKAFVAGLIGLMFLTSYAVSCPREKIVRRERVIVQKEVIRRQPIRQVTKFVAPPYHHQQKQSILLLQQSYGCSCNGQ